ncbi:MAG: hypothetical protein Greene101449_1325 [Candidatus Peregrinibacteria bacterium Greene1014_49]|nr:MAG: hypothetical protein Greene101449_1325 [Candidatus Peregrinibacteria bacterium Greene1014_49]
MLQAFCEIVFIRELVAFPTDLEGSLPLHLRMLCMHRAHALHFFLWHFFHHRHGLFPLYRRVHMCRNHCRFCRLRERKEEKREERFDHGKGGIVCSMQYLVCRMKIIWCSRFPASRFQFRAPYSEGIFLSRIVLPVLYILHLNTFFDHTFPLFLEEMLPLAP